MRRRLDGPASWSALPMLPLCIACLLGRAAAAGAQTPPASKDDPTFKVRVIETTPLPGVDLRLEEIPSAAQTATAADLDASGALDLSDFLNRRLSGVHVNELQGNPYQMDVSYRGYTASPLLGTPQGLSIYMDGVRLNQPFGDVVSWDLIPRMAIASTTLMPGSNPVFGLNTLGGALSIQTKDGRSHPGTTVQPLFGSHRRRALDIEHGGANAGKSLDWYLTGQAFAEDGWREASPSDVRQLFAKVGWHRTGIDLAATGAFADNSLTGNGLQEYRFLGRDYASIYTKPDITDNRAAFVNLTARRAVGRTWTLTGNGYYRRIHADTLNGDINEDSLDQAVYQPNAGERAALLAAGYTGVPASGATGANTPFPSWRCLADVLLNDEPAETCNGLLNRTRTAQHNEGLSGQVVSAAPAFGRANRFTVGASYDRAGVGFRQSTELGYLNPDRSITGAGAFGDGGVTGGTVDGEPFDTRVDLTGGIQTWSAYATDTLSGSRWHLTLSGRFNRTSIANRDRIRPGGIEGSLDGDHVFRRFNPAVGVTFDPGAGLNAYASYTEGSRAPTSVELGCADPELPCRLPNSLAGDPPLSQVVTRTVEAGIRRTAGGRVTWTVGLFDARNRDDIQFVASEQTGFGYFVNVGRTRRRGFEASATGWVAQTSVGASYTWLSATFGSAETLNGTGNSANDAAESGTPGVEGAIAVSPGDRIPLVPRHIVKAFADVRVTPAFSVIATLDGASGVVARGNENNGHEPDGVYYLGPGATAGYAVASLGVRLRVSKAVELVADVSNLFDRRYETAAQLGALGFTDQLTYAARPLPAVGGLFPVPQSTFVAPGAPRLFAVSSRITF